jgi:predicted transcriptional regulator of viral defense system
MYVSQSNIEEAKKLIQSRGGVIRTSEFLNAGFHQRVLYKMRDAGIVEQIERGLYRLMESEEMSNPDLIIVAKKVPEARICLISALSYHELTDEIPHSVHIALPKTSRDPVLNYPPLSVYRFSQETLEHGVQHQTIDGVVVNVFNPAKTIADCFKFRNQIGLSVAIEALKRGITENKASYKDIRKYAALCRVERVIQPYMETLAHG